MPGQGLVPARGNWESRWFEVNSTTTFVKGDAVNLDNAYRVRTYLSTDSQVLGISATSSTNSTSIGGVNKVQVYLPTPNCTAYSDLTTGLTQSQLSIGVSVGLYKQGNATSYATTLYGSLFSQVAKVAGPIDAANSRVEIAFNLSNVAFYSNSTATFAS